MSLTSVLLQVPPLSVTGSYLEQLAGTTSGNQVQVKDARNGKGKGVFAVKDFTQGDIIFRERPLLAMQHHHNSREATVCAHSHVFVGTVEHQIAKSLVNVIDSAAALSSGRGHDAVDSGEHSEAEDEEEQELQHRLELVQRHVSAADIQGLQSGSLKLPLSHKIELPTPVPCRGGCGAVYASEAAEQDAWSQHHCLLCTGSTHSTGSSSHPPHGIAPSTSSAGPGPGPSSSAGLSGGSARPDSVQSMDIHRAELAAFYEHAFRTNDIFMLVAKAVAMTALRAKQLQQQHQQQQQKAGEGSAGVQTGSCSDFAAYATWAMQQMASSRPNSDGAGPSASSVEAAPPGPEVRALLEAWLPLAVGWKRLWWESVAVPEDVEDGQAFREQLRELTQESLDLLKRALPGVTAQFPALMSLDVWGGLVGMFELNNLDLAVPSPVEDYFLLIDGLPEPERSQCQQSSQRWLDALDKWYDTPAQGTAFMALQSCANHSCEPNAAMEGEASGLTAVYATRAIKAGEEVTITYIEDDEDGRGKAMSYKQRQAALKDYGFLCQCSLCLREKERTEKKPARSGVKIGRKG